MRIDELTVDYPAAGRARIAARMNGSELWFNVPLHNELPATLADSFMIMGLAGSMLRNEALEVDHRYPVSEELLHNLNHVQEILRCWNPRFHKVEIRANTVSSLPTGTGVGSLYSGGVDSLHALVSRRQEVTAAVYIAGFDFDLSGDEAEALGQRNQSILQYFGLPCLTVHSNQLSWGRTTGVARNFWYSGYLAAASLFLGLERVNVPGSHSYGYQGRDGSHPLLDHHWSNGATTMRHVDSAFTRVAKTENIAKIPELLANLHVCWKYPDRNCGECDKCLRTMITLEVLGIDGPFPRKATPALIRRMRIKTPVSLDYVLENIMLASRQGRPDVVRALKAAIRRRDRSEAYMSLDRGFFGGALRRLRQRVRPYQALAGFTNERPDLDL